MITYPIKQISLEEAIKLQFKLVDIIQSIFRGHELLEAGDYGVSLELGRPKTTAKVEQVLAKFFDAEDCALVRGAGTGAMRLVFNGLLKPLNTLLIHDAPVYPTTQNLIDMMGLKLLKVNMNNLDSFKILKNTKVDAVLIQHSRQKPDDSYELEKVIKVIKSITNVPIITDENYVVMKAPFIGVQLGADVSVFSMFKLLGPEGIGCAVGKKHIIDEIRKKTYSGGSQVQGPEAMEALRSLVYTPVSLAIQAMQVDEIAKRLNDGEIKGVKKAYVANAQSRVVLVEFEEPIAEKVLKYAEEIGGVPYPVGSESRYEIGAMFYRVSGTFIKDNPEIKNYVIRINPMRAGADTVIRILKEAVKKSLA
ncbi:aminotransferase class V-fold PLP-dependent enzyme [Thermoanaerobacter pentosaceus]|uniref:Cystathionine beta-lyase family protein involved in aluminum resistance n=1 Tax=Thermoanaerobacter pentosaceus TaxID=694059 RepID=A0ABT9M4E2_9THEO|nr:aminotransferase class V-fold PLP-dependent enzyme [Thermoanaerobacter pentosaceus]MDP9751002.1 cystathionine beta-lyase family protein involved in aluminum resistance [Thermoanaerobacter pentosaceus]